jgi:DNA-binding response OmpR family regulator
MQILLIEDELDLANGIAKALSKAGFSVNILDRGLLALTSIKTSRPDIVILDLGLPDSDGIQVLKKIRNHDSALPVLILTARSAMDDRVKGLDAGADDYLIKPFDMAELMARLRVFERRLSTSQSSLIELQQVTLDINAQTLKVDAAEIELPRREYMLLKALMENAGRVQTRANLESKLYSWGEEVSSNALEVHIHQLRKQLPEGFIKTIRGVGYKVNKA